MRLDRNRSFSTIRSAGAGQKVFFIQDEIEYDNKGEPISENQVKAFHAKKAADAQTAADAALATANAAQEAADQTREDLGVSKTATKKAAKG